MSSVIFFIAAIGVIAGAIGVIALNNPFYSVLALVVHLVSLSALFLLLRAEFVAAAQVIVYAGAVMVLYVFVVSYVGGQDEPVGPAPRRSMLLAAWACGGAIALELMIAVLGSGLAMIDSHGAPYVPGFGGPSQIGRLLLTKFLAPFEVASFLLLIAAVGAVVLARRRAGIDEDGGDGVPTLSAMDVFRPRSPGTGTMAEAIGGSRHGSGPPVPLAAHGSGRAMPPAPRSGADDEASR